MVEKLNLLRTNQGSVGGQVGQGHEVEAGAGADPALVAEDHHPPRAEVAVEAAAGPEPHPKASPILDPGRKVLKTGKSLDQGHGHQTKNKMTMEISEFKITIQDRFHFETIFHN